MNREWNDHNERQLDVLSKCRKCGEWYDGDYCHECGPDCGPDCEHFDVVDCGAEGMFVNCLAPKGICIKK
jgi:hypothetical protein